ncbi:hypothetical protein DFP92_104232 [Yoonia sediminilitoris]|uniref:Uncharacterized protein n=1 Tax=Yoonia sediminilitoris TaxID=1286148 RepID=A0A2T6KIR9_9RHOB|nr:hypothetical protein C8N45_104233 [Yoonia sediminilitoris]RCW96222.1 hypothetical protein DFP92_104232 [Yoonia sediminilitoris]
MACVFASMTGFRRNLSRKNTTSAVALGSNPALAGGSTMYRSTSLTKPEPGLSKKSPSPRKLPARFRLTIFQIIQRNAVHDRHKVFEQFPDDL